MIKARLTVAVVVHCRNHFLLVEECIDGHYLLNQPAGHVEAGESLWQAACRELNEETGLTARPSHALSVHQFVSPEGDYFLRTNFVLELTDFPASLTPQDSDIHALHWLDAGQLQQRRQHLRSPLVIRAVEDYFSGRQLALSQLHYLDLSHGG